MRASLDGVSSRHEIDVLVRNKHSMVLIECKDHNFLPDRDVRETYFSLIDVALCHPEHVITGLLLSRTGFARSNLTAVSKAPGVYITPPNLAGPLRALTVPVLVRNQSIGVAFEHKQERLNAHVFDALCGEELRVANGRVDVEEVLHSPDLSVRLRGSLSILAQSDRASHAFVAAATEAATGYLHLGAAVPARLMARIAVDAARGREDRHYAEAALVVETMADFQHTVHDVRRPSGKPGVRGVRRLLRAVEDFQPWHRSSARCFVGAWHGLYGDVDHARRLLQLALRDVEVVPPEEGAYLAFMAEFRLAELARGEARSDALMQAALRLPDLTPVHKPLASELITRAEAGRDASLHARFGDV